MVAGKKRQPARGSGGSSGPSGTNKPVGTRKPGGSKGSGTPPAKEPRKQTAAQTRLAAQRALAAASGARAQRRARLLKTVIAPIAVVVVVVLVIVIVGVTHKSKSPVSHTPVAASAALQSAVTGVPASVYDKIGLGAGVNSPPTATSGQPPLTSGGKPELLYVGAEWCPYCAAERWVLAATVARFGKLGGLQTTYSSNSDVDKNTPTLTFAKSTYTSNYITFAPHEIQDQNHKTLQTLSSADNALFVKLGSSSFPFIDIGGKYTTAVNYDPGVLKGKTHAQIAQAMSDPNSKIGQAIGGSTNYLTAAVCASTNQQPAAVCNSSGVKLAAAQLGSGTS